MKERTGVGRSIGWPSTIAKWWMPDDVLFVDELPHGATGKLLKTKLRELYGSYTLPTVDRAKSA